MVSDFIVILFNGFVIYGFKLKVASTALWSVGQMPEGMSKRSELVSSMRWLRTTEPCGPTSFTS